MTSGELALFIAAHSNASSSTTTTTTTSRSRSSAAAAAAPVILVVEGREDPIRMKRQLPYRWLEAPTTPTLNAVVRPVLESRNYLLPRICSRTLVVQWPAVLSFC